MTKPKDKHIAPFHPQTFLKHVDSGKTMLTWPKKRILFSEGNAADAVFYIQTGQVTLTVISSQGKEAIVALLEPGAFFGEECLAGQLVCMGTAAATGKSTFVRIDNQAMIRVLHDEPTFSELFLAYLLSRSIRIQEDLVDQLFNSSEKRLARVLLLMAHFGKEGSADVIIPKISQDALAERSGTTRSPVSFFMNKFGKLGFLDYNGGVHVHSSFLNIVLHDQRLVLRLILRGGAKAIFCLINSSHLSNFDQTPAGLLGIVFRETCLHTHVSNQTTHRSSRKS